MSDDDAEGWASPPADTLALLAGSPELANRFRLEQVFRRIKQKAQLTVRERQLLHDNKDLIERLLDQAEKKK